MTPRERRKYENGLDLKKFRAAQTRRTFKRPKLFLLFRATGSGVMRKRRRPALNAYGRVAAIRLVSSKKVAKLNRKDSDENISLPLLRRADHLSDAA